MISPADRKVSRGVYLDRAAAVEGGVDTAGTVEPPFSPDTVQSSGYSADLGPHQALEPPRHRGAEVRGGAKPDGPLVSYSISQTDQDQTFELYPKTIKVKRPFFQSNNTPPDRTGTEIQGFSKKSRSGVRFTASNAPTLAECAQFVATYHNIWPINGRELKRQLNLFLTRLRKYFTLLDYMWITEFQFRGAPHFHIYMNIEASEENRRIIGQIWHEIAGWNDEHHRWWHVDRVEHNGQSALIPWQMNAGYICKYLDKEHQKHVPEGFQSVGRWWGCSRGLVPKPEVITAEELNEEFPELDEETGELYEDRPVVQLVRVVGRYHERCNSRSFFRNTPRSTSALTGAPIFRQMLDYLRRNRGKPDEPSPF
jgi:hypothetical protein